MDGALEHRFHVPEYFLRIIWDYLSVRVLIYDITEGLKQRLVTAGAAQGPKLRPDFWNVNYNGILELEIPVDLLHMQMMLLWSLYLGIANQLS